MSINIKNKEAERLLADIKARTGRGTTDLLLELLRKEQARLDAHTEEGVSKALENMRWLQERWRSLPVVDPRPLEQIIDYDDDGLPR